jgi:hypothetical protein
MNDAPLIRLTGMYENTAAKSGRRYFVGYLGAAKLLLLENTKAEPGEPGWNLCITARPERQDTPRKPAMVPSEREPALAGTSPAPAVTMRQRPSRAVQGAPDDDVPFDDPLPF